jgi:hypothetical protein
MKQALIQQRQLHYRWNSTQLNSSTIMSTAPLHQYGATSNHPPGLCLPTQPYVLPQPRLPPAEHMWRGLQQPLWLHHRDPLHVVPAAVALLHTVEHDPLRPHACQHAAVVHAQLERCCARDASLRVSGQSGTCQL